MKQLLARTVLCVESGDEAVNGTLVSLVEDTNVRVLGRKSSPPSGRGPLSDAAADGRVCAERRKKINECLRAAPNGCEAFVQALKVGLT